MKKFIVLLFIPFILLADYYDTTSASFTNKLPRPLVYLNRSILNPKWSDYYAAGWRLSSSSRSEMYSIPISESVKTNISSAGNETIFHEIIYSPITISKPEFVQASEAQYCYTWHLIFGESNYGYTNATYENVAVSIMNIAQTNSSILEYTHVMERSFGFIQNWWSNATHRSDFHPYPWGITNIVIKDVIEGK